MVSVSLRQNQAATPDQNTHDDQAVTRPRDGRFALAAQRNRAGTMMLIQQPFYRHPNLGPGAPLVQITGTGETAGFYDWAGRRLFLPDGEPDPTCPGTYRHQHNPSSCDVDAPDSDPRSPRYEPPHLRHQPGDTWLIDRDRPHDPFDRGPYGTPGWSQDRRTGRHRRDEAPDPLPAEGWIPPEHAWYPGMEARSGSPGQADESSARPRSDRPDPPSPSPRPNPSRPRRQFWGESETNAAVDESLREQAWGRFMTDSAPLAAAHHRVGRSTAFEREAGGAWALWIALVKWLLALIRSTKTTTAPATTASARQGDGLRPSFCSPGSPGSRTMAGPRLQKERAALTLPPPHTLHPTRPATTRTQAITDSAMARAIAGAQRSRARTGAPAWA